MNARRRETVKRPLPSNRAFALRATLAVAGISIAATLAHAAQLRHIEIDRDSGRYTLYAETFLAAAPEDIYDVLLDYDRFNRISSVYKEHGYMDPDPDGTPIVFTRMEGCLLFFCVSMKRVERLEAERPAITQPGVIRTIALPEQSDFRYSASEWTLAPEGDGTMMTYSLIMEPDFWVPPVIGPWYLKRTLQRGGTTAITRIENLAVELRDGEAAQPDPNAG